MSSAEFPPPQLRSAAEDVASLLKSRGETICVAETAAGGLISASLLATPGASRIYKGGLTLYTLQSRIAFAGWTQQNIDNYDGPTPELVEDLAKSVRATLQGTYCVGRSPQGLDNGDFFSLTRLLSTQQSGTAGPTASGKTPNRQPGYVALAVVGEKGSVNKDLDTGLGSDRQANMVAFAVAALQLVKDFILSSGGDKGGKM
ncbi:putative competence/damage-inducible CinA family protein [Fonsecaea pedrosoi]|nr:putative competence/damage-inducible CinA family protein [Fonsecaea pedrosoi]